MSQTVNLLAWRVMRRRACLRFWALMFAGVAMIAACWWFSEWNHSRLELRHRELIRQSHANCLLALTLRERQLQAIQSQQAQQQQRALWQQATSRWQSSLTSLAEALPPQTWLIQLEWQDALLSLIGYARNFSALSSLEIAMKRVPDFHSASPGITERDAENGWRFSYHLSREAPHADTR